MMKLTKKSILYTFITILVINMIMLTFFLPNPMIYEYILITSMKTRALENLELQVWYNNTTNENDDRIEAQMRYIPKSVQEKVLKNETVPYKFIFVYGGALIHARNDYKGKKCAVNFCKVTSEFRLINEVDVVLTMGHTLRRPEKSPAHQIWILYLLESPYHSVSLKEHKNVYNWTATYRLDSDIVTPYEKFVLYDSNIRTKKQTKNYADGKTKKVAWFVSNCFSKNKRREYAKDLGQHIQVDIYGRCGPLTCARKNHSKCFDMLNKDYKFYLAFENSNCKDYITEKFFVNGLRHNIVPIVMGASPEDYRKVAPHNSFIHVDDFESPKHLAEYLDVLDKNDTLYNKYFQWKGTGSFINTLFWCRLCAMAHGAPYRDSITYKDVDQWWRGPGTCIGHNSWRSKANNSNLSITTTDYY